MDKVFPNLKLAELILQQESSLAPCVPVTPHPSEPGSGRYGEQEPSLPEKSNSLDQEEDSCQDCFPPPYWS